MTIRNPSPHLLRVQLCLPLHAGGEASGQVLVDGLQLVQHVIDLLPIVDVMEAVEPCQLHDVLIVGIVRVEDDRVLWDGKGKRW